MKSVGGHIWLLSCQYPIVYLDDRVLLQVDSLLAKYIAELASALAVHSAVVVSVLRPHG